MAYWIVAMMRGGIYTHAESGLCNHLYGACGIITARRIIILFLDSSVVCLRVKQSGNGTSYRTQIGNGVV